MQKVIDQSAGQFTPQFPPLEQITSPSVSTEQAAFYLNRSPQTLRRWACQEDGPIRPFRIYGRLAWPTFDICSLLGVLK